MVSIVLLRPALILVTVIVVLVDSVPLPSPQCRSCTTDACNNTLDENSNDSLAIIQSNRTKRESSIEYRSCNQIEVQFQLEIVFIPLAIAMIPVGLLALLLCVFCCGPTESRGKMPEKFSSKKKSVESAPTTDSNAVGDSNDEIDGIELVCKDGIVMRKGSTKTRFSTAIYFIESRRVSIDIIDDTGSVVSTQPTGNDDVVDEKLFKTIQDKGVVQPKSLNDVTEVNNQVECLPRRTTSLKKTRFADSVDIIGETVLSPQKLLLKQQA